MDTILIGTTSWTEKSLIESGRFYPPEAKSAEARLRYYASQFPIVEVDSSYYAIPREETTQKWAERTPPGFVFDVKAFRLFTHHRTPIAMLPPDVREEVAAPDREDVYLGDVPEAVVEELWRRFRASLEPLRRAGKLGAVLVQFAPWFVYRTSSLEHMARCAAELEGLQVAVELRNKSWFERHRRDTLEHERRIGVANVVADEPQGTGHSVPPVWEVTIPGLAVVRLHGRNRATWRARELASAAERFDYLYDESELGELVGPIRRLAEDANHVHVLFNNCHRDYAQRNAATLRDLMSA